MELLFVLLNGTPTGYFLPLEGFRNWSGNPNRSRNCQNSGFYVDRVAYQLLRIAVGSSPLRLWSSQYWEPFIQRMKDKLAPWKKNFISLERGITLIMAACYQTSCLLPLSLWYALKCDGITQRVTGFFWSSKDAAGAHLVGWTKATKLVEEGGLGLGRLKGKYSPLQEWLWRFPLEQETLWTRVIKSIHGMSKNKRDASYKLSASHKSPWKAISNILPEISKHIKVCETVPRQDFGKINGLWFCPGGAFP